MPGLPLISKLAEDFPWVDYHSRNKEGQRADNFKHRHQDVFVFGMHGSKSFSRIKKIMRQRKKSGKTNFITVFKEYNNIRYTFVRNLFRAYGMLRDPVPESKYDFGEHLKLLQSSYIWNIYKHLTQDFLEKTVRIPYNQVQANMRDKVLEPLKIEIMKIPV